MLERAGAEVLVLCTNTMHAVADVIEAAVTIPLLHVADPTAEAVRRAGLDRVALLGTRYTMELPFYRDVLARRGVAVDVPGERDRATLQQIIYDELVQGVVTDESRDRYLTRLQRQHGWSLDDDETWLARNLVALAASGSRLQSAPSVTRPAAEA